MGQSLPKMVLYRPLIRAPARSGRHYPQAGGIDIDGGIMATINQDKGSKQAGTQAGNQGGNQPASQAGTAGANQGSAGSTRNRGFASMDPARQREIASEGGKAAHQKGTAHEFTSEEARRAGSMSHGNRQSAQAGQRGGTGSGGTAGKPDGGEGNKQS